MAMLSRVILLVRDVPTSAKFFTQGLGLNLARLSQDERNALLTYHTDSDLSPSTPPGLSLRFSDVEAELTPGYSTLLSFTLDDLDDAVIRCVQLGAHLDGPVKHTVNGKVDSHFQRDPPIVDLIRCLQAASLRTPDGHMVGLYEPV